ncbi:uncharacterized protein LOC114847416 isoform X2 [Betta splendens]|uniref:Uncharacterized protein LOC114847416 isoform X2 n=1 Tax=Betta splendens TaxID=158456 RepID=A0A9W2XH17_BETSP|nr:uncharacterized protein LOC114847416 isoform X2 [Betta splendens]
MPTGMEKEEELNRKNDEMSYEKMLKLRREFSRTVTILEMIKRREKSKRELLHLTLEVVERRYQMGDFSGDVIRQVSLPLMGKPGNCVPQMEVISEGNVSDLLPQCLCHSLGKLSLPPYWIGLSRRRMERGAVLSMQHSRSGESGPKTLDSASAQFAASAMVSTLAVAHGHSENKPYRTSVNGVCYSGPFRLPYSHLSEQSTAFISGLVVILLPSVHLQPEEPSGIGVSPQLAYRSSHCLPNICLKDCCWCGQL